MGFPMQGAAREIQAQALGDQHRLLRGHFADSNAETSCT